VTFPILRDQRFWRFRLNELFDTDSVVVETFAKECGSALEVANRIIREVEYPFYMGSPNDSHQLLAFRDRVVQWRWKRCVELDFWQKASETLVFLIGDCEDSSIVFVTCVHILVPKDPKYAYELFGVVRDADTKEILGGHGWAVSKGLPDDRYRLYESTLDTPPSEYPVVPDPFKPFRIGRVVYEPEWVFNKYEFHLLSMGSPSRRTQREKETEEKYRAIAEAFGVDVKPLRARRKSRLVRIRKALRSLVRR